jgi:outer membrane protein assembly factor BamB
VKHRPCAMPAATLLLLAACLFGCGTSDGGEDAGPSTSAGPASTADAATPVVPPEVSEHADDWPLPGRDHANSRAVAESPITSATVAQLQVAWSGPLEGASAFGNASTTPLVLGDRVFVQDLQSNVSVFNRDSGDLVWKHTVDQFQIGPNGVAVGYGRVYAAKGTKEIMALDLDSGDELWTVGLAETPTAGIDIQPQIAAGLVLVSTVPVSVDGQFVGGDRGVIYALDADTGEVVWSFDTVAGDDLWGDPAVNSGGGAWYPPAVDPDAGVVYWGTANPAPFPGTPGKPNGSSRPGPNLYSDSVLALELRTGKLLWYDQVFEHDLFDRDHVHTMIVPTSDTTTVVSTGKGGVVIGHDPATGDELWRTAVGTHRDDDLTELDGPTEIWPGTFGGVLTPPAHADGVVYVATVNAPTELSPDQTGHIGSELDRAPGALVAVDASDGTVRWSTEIPGDPLGGATVVGDLVLTGTYQGEIYAVSRASGDIVWQYTAPGGINGWPAVAGDLIVWPIGMADPPTLLALRLPSPSD